MGFYLGTKEYKLQDLTQVIDQVEIAQIGTSFVPMRGRGTLTYRLKDGPDFVGTYAMSRTDVQLNPDFSEADSFKTDAPDGAEAFVMQELDAGVRYVWRHGEVVPAFTNFAGEATGVWGKQSWWVITCWALLGLGLSIVGIWLIRRAKQTT